MSPQQQTDRVVRIHLSIGWWSLVLFILLGTLLEVMHGLKLGFYLDVSNSTRRLMWTLAHAHGTLIGLLHIAFAATTWAFGAGRWTRAPSALMIAATILMPTGFFLGGVSVHSGDPSPLVLLVPPGALALLAAALLVARRCSRT